MVPYRVVFVLIRVHAHTHTHTHTHTHASRCSWICAERYQQPESRPPCTSLDTSPRSLSPCQNPISPPLVWVTLNFSPPPLMPLGMHTYRYGYAHLRTRTLVHASTPWYEHIRHLFSHHTHSLVFSRTLYAGPSSATDAHPCSRTAAAAAASLPRLSPPLFAAPQGFEQLAFGLWELFKISGNSPASHHLLIPSIRDL
jgi:hypothetical protein